MKYRLKDYFRFSKAERRGIYFLVSLIFLLIAAKQQLIYLNPSPEVEVNEDVLTKRLSTISIKEKENRNSPEFVDSKKEKSNIELHPFNPNQMTQAEWQQFGLSEKQAAVILNYLKTGGRFKTKSDLLKMYSISDRFFAQIKPYINLPDSLPETPKTAAKKISVKNKKKVQRWSKPIIEINSADSLSLQKLYGIGPVFSYRIVKYRNQLGGFHSIRQLSEVYGIKDSLIDKLSAQLKLDSIELKKININTAEVEELGKHPYISWNLANSIVKYREQHGKYNSVEEISRSKLVNDSLLNRLKPYLTE